jgi:hypothetical protein
LTIRPIMIVGKHRLATGRDAVGGT